MPLKFSGGITYYYIPESVTEELTEGSWVVVTMVGKRYLAVIRRIDCPLPDGLAPDKILPIEKAAALKPLPKVQLELWQMIADYYLCSIGEVFKCAYPAAFFRQSEKKRTVKSERQNLPAREDKQLSPDQQQALEQIERHFGDGKGESVLYLVPEIAMSRQLEQRLRRSLGDRLLVFHSKQTFPTRKRVFDALSEGGNYLILGTRSALFLPLGNLGFIIVDEEHDTSYKQSDPAPRYNGRDVALMMAAKLSVNTLLGSATPSMESLYNVSAGKYALVTLRKTYFGAGDAPVTVIDMGKVYAMHNARGSLSMQLVNMMDKCLKEGKQVMVFRSRRSYSSFMQCDSCGHTLRCPRCNVSLTYHKYNNSLTCHYCGYHAPFNPVCDNCGKGTYAPKGAGTERIAEELRELFPTATIDRFDLETAASRTTEKKILSDFESGATDILVGTQMITKGFDFEKLGLVAVISGDSILSLQDFRADEKGIQLFTQLRGRVSRREGTGQMAIQAMQADHPVLQALAGGDSALDSLRNDILLQRKLFGFPPYVRLIRITLKDASADKLRRACTLFESALKASAVADFTPATAPAVDRIAGMYIRFVWVKLPRTGRAQNQKSAIVRAADSVRKSAPSTDIVIDVDPL